MVSLPLKKRAVTTIERVRAVARKILLELSWRTLGDLGLAVSARRMKRSGIVMIEPGVRRRMRRVVIVATLRGVLRELALEFLILEKNEVMRRKRGVMMTRPPVIRSWRSSLLALLGRVFQKRV